MAGIFKTTKDELSTSRVYGNEAHLSYFVEFSTMNGNGVTSCTLYQGNDEYGACEVATSSTPFAWGRDNCRAAVGELMERVAVDGHDLAALRLLSELAIRIG